MKMTLQLDMAHATMWQFDTADKRSLEMSILSDLALDVQSALMCQFRNRAGSFSASAGACSFLSKVRPNVFFLTLSFLFDLTARPRVAFPLADAFSLISFTSLTLKRLGGG